MGLYTFSGLMGPVQWNNLPDPDRLKIGTYSYDSATDKWFVVTKHREAKKTGPITVWTKHAWYTVPNVEMVPKQLRTMALLVPS